MMVTKFKNIQLKSVVYTYFIAQIQAQEYVFFFVDYVYKTE